MAEGADHEPSARRATTTPDPNRAVPRKPALKTVRIARPCLAIDLENVSLHHKRVRESPVHTYFRISQYLRRYNLIWSKSLPRVYK